MSRRSVAIVVKYFPPYPRISGVLTYISTLAEELGRHHDVHVVTCTMPPDLAVQETSQTCTVHRVERPFVLTAASALRRLEPDVVVTVSGIYDLRLAVAYFLPSLLLSGRSSTKVFYQATWPDRTPNQAFTTFARRYSKLLTASPGIGEIFDGKGLLNHAIRPAVDVQRLTAAASQRSGGGPKIGFVNHLNHVKGADLAAEVISRLADQLPDSTFVIAGEGDLEETVAQRHAGSPRVELMGFLPEDRRIEVLASCDVMLLPFRQAASVLGVSQTALEVMALGNVVIGTRTGSLDGAIVDGRNGILVDPDGDVVTSMTRAVIDLCGDPNRMDRMRAAAQADAIAQWSIERRAEELSAVLELG